MYEIGRNAISDKRLINLLRRLDILLIYIDEYIDILLEKTDKKE